MRFERWWPIKPFTPRMSTFFIFTASVFNLKSATGNLLAYTAASTPGGATLNVGRNFINDGYANLALAALNFNGSGSTLSGSGNFQGGLYGIIRTLSFQNTGSNAITTTENLIVSS